MITEIMSKEIVEEMNKNAPAAIEEIGEKLLDAGLLQTIAEVAGTGLSETMAVHLLDALNENSSIDAIMKATTNIQKNLDTVLKLACAFVLYNLVLQHGVDDVHYGMTKQAADEYKAVMKKRKEQERGA